MNPTTAYQIKITLDFGNLQPIIEWCERNCEGEWGYNTLSGIQIHTPYKIHNYQYEFYFESERDYVAFTMWKK